MEKTIDLDCPPGSPRPGDLIVEVIIGTGLVKKKPSSTFFGNWTWDYSDISPSEWEKAKPVIKERLTVLYNTGVVRYASWYSRIRIL